MTKNMDKMNELEKLMMEISKELDEMKEKEDMARKEWDELVRRAVLFEKERNAELAKKMKKKERFEKKIRATLERECADRVRFGEHYKEKKKELKLSIRKNQLKLLIEQKGELKASIRKHSKKMSDAENRDLCARLKTKENSLMKREERLGVQTTK